MTPIPGVLVDMVIGVTEGVAEVEVQDLRDRVLPVFVLDAEDEARVMIAVSVKVLKSLVVI